MCRIAGIINKGLSLQQLNESLLLMCRALEHGGPDDQGIYCDEQVSLAFGHRRLSIIDLSKNGHQPMADTRRTVWITFNGEIFNYLELKQELIERGITFCSGTDTEVIIEAYRYWGIDSFKKLRGMFAFALYDTIRQQTYLVRDTTGIKPLYYSAYGQNLIFASEVKAFKESGLRVAEEPGWKIRFLAYGHIPEPFTTLKDVYNLKKGHYLVWDHQTSSAQIASYAAEHPVTLVTDIRLANKLINEGLKSAVRRQLLSDAPIGVFLSGGIDSSLLTLLANQQKESQLKTISIFFNEKAYDEQSFQNLILNNINGEKFSHLVRQEDFDHWFPNIINGMDMPTTDGINTWFISKYARQGGLKAVLSGVGADELFGGYPSFQRIKYLKHLRKLPTFLLKGANYLSQDKYRKVSFLTHEQPVADYLLLRGLFVQEDIAKILGSNLNEINKVLFTDVDIPPLSSYDEGHAAWFETNLYMQNQLLRDTDVMGMSHGLEIRVPFLDEDFRDIVASISPAIRFDAKKPKKVLIDSFTDILPKQIWNRPKMGFTFPLQEWMSSSRQIGDSHLYKTPFEKQILKRFKLREVHWSKIFALYQLGLHA